MLMLKCWSWCCSWHFGHLILRPQECFWSSSSVSCTFWLQHRGDLEREISLKLPRESLLKNHKVVVGAGRILTSRPALGWCWCWCWHLDQGQQGHMHIVSTARRILTSWFLKVLFKKRKLLKVVAGTGRILTSRPIWGSFPSWNPFARPGLVNPATWWELLLFCLIFCFCCFVIWPSRLMRVFVFCCFAKLGLYNPAHIAREGTLGQN